MRRNFLTRNYVRDFLHVSGFSRAVKTAKIGNLHLNAAIHQCSESSEEESLPLEWYKEKYPKLIKLSNLLKSIDLVDGKLVDVNDSSIVNDERLLRRMHKFKAISKAFLGNPSVQEEIMRNVKTAMAGSQGHNRLVCFTKPVERDPLIINTFTKMCNVLGVSAQQRKTVRISACKQITQHRIWTGALEEILRGLKAEIELLPSNHRCRKGTYMGQQVVATCLKFLNETAGCEDEVTSSWMRPNFGIVPNLSSSKTWDEVLDMFRDLISYLKKEESLKYHLSKLDAMKEGLYHINDIVIVRDIGYKEVLHREGLVQARLVKALGHSSRCLFTLLRYYLHRTIRDIEVDVCGGFCQIGLNGEFCLYMGKFLTSDTENMISSGIKQLDQALGLFKFVFDSAEMKTRLELHGHLWCVGAESRTITYNGNLFFLHGINP